MNSNPSMAGIASLVQSRGRDGDTMLVHMAPEEVKGLQSLALAAGGSLSINPDTGLYEANFLKKLLPTLLGFGLNFLFPGLGALGSGLLVGAGETIRTGGDLGKGLMAGLGAFGGAGLGSALAGAGAVAGGAGQAGITAAGETAAAEAAKQGAQQAAIEAAKKKAIEEATKKAVAEQAATKGIASGATGWQNIKAGAGSLFKTSPGIGALGGADALGATFNALPGGMIGKAGLVTSAANVLTPDMEVPGDGYNIDDSYYESYGYSPEQGRFLGGQWRKGYPGFPGYAMGGPVMPRTNFNYPQAGITKSNYAPNLEYAKPREILDGYDTKVDPFTGAEGFADGGSVQQPTNVVDRAASVGTFDPTGPAAPSQMEQYYQGLIAPPQQTAADPKFAEYLQNLNKFVTSPVAPPPPPPQPPQTPPAKPPGDPNVPGGTNGTNPILGGMKWDPTQGRFVPGGGGSVGDTGIDLSELQNLVNSGMFSGFNFGDLGNYLQNGGYGDTTGLTYDPATGSFRQPGSQTVDTAPGTQNQFDPRNFQNPFVDGFDMSSLPDYGQAQGNLTGIDQFADPMYAQQDPYGPQIAEEYDFMRDRRMLPDFQKDSAPNNPMYSSISTAPNQGQMQGMDPTAINLAQMGDMGGYANQFQGFQPQSTDFGSTYQPTDFGGMGGYGLGALGTTYSAPSFAMPSFDFTSQTPAVPTTSYSAPMTTGAGSTGVSAPQYGFGNSDVMYGKSMLGGDEQNIFGFAGGGAIQKAAAGKLVTGDGDGMSDDIRANINGDQEARLADGEFVIPADVVSHLGNGSTDAGADRLYSMMDRIRKARTGRTRQAPEIDAEKYLPA